MTPAGNPRTVVLLFRLARPRQWIKNGACLAGVVFSGKMTDPPALLNAAAAFLAFSLVSSAGYAVNDILDRERDRANPRTRRRPIAAGDLSVGAAAAFAFLLYAPGYLVGGALGVPFLVVLVFYVAIGALYTSFLKHMVLLDVFSIALGFMLRVLGGIYAVSARPTAWIILCTMFLSLFLGFGKRRTELASVEAPEGSRPVLRLYSKEFLDSLLQMTGGIAVICYALFTVASHRTHSLVLTVPFVAYGILRYLYLVMVGGHGESPEDLLLRDPPLLAVVLLWLLSVTLILYSGVDLVD